MDPLIQLKRTVPIFLVVLGLACFGLLPQMRAAPQVAPTPDGCYPNYTTAEGCNALNFLTTGSGNTGVGWYSLFSDSIGSFNTGVGGGALALNDADSNTAVGAAALLLNTSGTENTATGTDALVFNDSGDQNSAVGAFALFSNIGGSDNTAIGDSALENNDVTGDGLGNDNSAVGAQALFANTDGESNTGVGFEALASNTTGSFNVAIGANALSSNDTGIRNVAIGDSALDNNVSGFHNIVVGGGSAGFNIVAGINNIYIGYGVSANGALDESGTVRINDSAPAAGGATSQVFFAGIDGSTVGAINSPVLVNPNGQLGTAVSSARFKKDIDSMRKTSEAIFSLRPVIFHYKGDSRDTPQFGLIAEEVAKVNPALVLPDKEGKPYSVRYDAVNAMLLNEFLKEHTAFFEEQRKIEQQGAMIAQQQKQIEALTAGLRKVRAQIEAAKPAPQIVLNNQ